MPLRKRVLAAQISSFVSVWAPIFIFWPVLYDIFKELGYEKGEKYPTIAVILAAISTILGFPVPPYMGNILLLSGNYATLTADLPGGPVVINNATYLCTVVILGMVLCALLVLTPKLILRSDVERLKNISRSTFFMCATAIYLGGTLNSGATGIMAFLSLVLNPMFANLSPIAFTIIPPADAGGRLCGAAEPETGALRRFRQL